MAFYDLRKAEDRERMRQERQAELTAINEGRWPRDINDSMRWNPGYGYTHKPEKWAAKMCKADIEYLGLKDKEGFPD